MNVSLKAIIAMTMLPVMIQLALSLVNVKQVSLEMVHIAKV